MKILPCITFTISTGLLLMSLFVFQQEDQEESKGDSQDQSKKQEDDRMVIPSDDPNAISRRDFMRTKLMYTQNIFEGLTVGDFDQIEAAVEEVQAITEGGKWVAIDNDTYRRLTDEFNTSTKQLMKAAKSGNIDATALRFYEMSTRCIDCHQHIRQAKYDL